jgi:hypothetical protein
MMKKAAFMQLGLLIGYPKKNDLAYASALNHVFELGQSCGIGF